MANAAANAEATAQTSVRVVPDIQTSIRSIIDPECLTPVCEEIKPCPPCDEPRIPETTPPTDTGCSEPIPLEWAFGEIPAGVSFRSSRSIPTPLGSTVARHPIADAFIIDQTLPPGGSMLVDFDSMMGTVSGTFEPGTTYSVTYLLLDPAQCPIIEFLFTVTAAGTPQDEGKPAETPTTPPTTRACMTVSSVFEVPGFLFFPATTTDISTTVNVNDQDERLTPFQLCAAATTQFGLRASDTASGADQVRAPFDRWEKYDPIEQSWVPVGENPLIYVPLQSGASYRAVFAQQGIGTIVPPTARQQQVCLEVSAVFMYQQIGTTALYAQPQFVTEPINAQILVNDVARTTQFRLCDDPGSRFVLVPAEEHWTAREDRLEFWKWQRYNAETEAWDDILQLLFGNAEPGQLSVNLQSGGQLRAVYRQAVGLY
jgi:hypothetical protein